MEATPLESVSSSDLKSAHEDWRENHLLNTLKAAMTEAKRLGQYPLVWNHGIDSACKKEIESKGYKIQKIDKWQYWLWDPSDVKEEE